jgi:hypothetical protein
MIIQFKPSALRQTRWYEYLIRFGLGGAMTVVAGLIAARFGPVIGGLFLAFPAIFPASATLIEKHVRWQAFPDSSRGDPHPPPWRVSIRRKREPRRVHHLFDCRSENGRLEAAKRGLMLALHLAKADNAAASELSPLASDSKMR